MSGDTSDSPRMFADPRQVALRREELSKPHAMQLAAFVNSLRVQFHSHTVPDFDPWDGGTRAKALFLFEKPGRMAAASGFISRNNDDGTAANTFEFMRRAGIAREKTCMWNVVPFWDGTTHLDAAQLACGAMALSNLMHLLSELRVVVLVGSRAANAWFALKNAGDLPTIRSAHPSPVNRAFRRASWEAIPAEWAKAKEFICTK